eukprot:scaffold26033_cov104-Isochrysis_galbana.AAC.3
MGGNVAREKWWNWSFWRIGRLCLATAPPWAEDVEYDTAPWKRKRAVSSGGLRFQEGLRSARSMAAGWLAGYSRLHLRIELASASEGPPGFARSRGGDARHLKQSGCCGDDGVVKIKVCRPNVAQWAGVRWCEATRNPEGCCSGQLFAVVVREGAATPEGVFAALTSRA